METKCRLGQRVRLLALLRSNAPHWVELPEIPALSITQYKARILELCRLGHRIDTRQGELDVPPVRPITIPDSAVEDRPNTFPEFGDLRPYSYPD